MARVKVSKSRSKTAQTTKGITHLQSLNVIRNMIRVSVSETCYLRNLFPDELFKERVYADMHIKCLAPTKEMASKDADDAMLITKWLEDGVFEALEKKYLASLALCVYAITADSKPTELLESYTYNIKHTSNGSSELSTSFTGTSPLNCSAQNVKAQAIQLIRSLVSITNNLDPLPRNRLITMKVYFNDTTPENWQPQHFQKTSECFRDHDPSSSLKIDVGRVVTPHHFVSMEIETAEECLESISQANPNSGVLSQVQPDDVSEGATTDDENPSRVASDDACSQVHAIKDTEGVSPEDNNVETSIIEVTDVQPLEMEVVVEDIDATESEDNAATSVITKKSDAKLTDDRSVTMMPVVQTPRSPDRAVLVSFIVLSDRIDKQSVERRFPSCSSAQIVKLLEELEDANVLRKTPQNNTFEVTVHDTDMFYGAINETHGKLKRQVTIEGLAEAMDIETNLAEALILRMAHEKLVRRNEDAQGFDVLFSDSNRPLVRKAIQRVKEQKTKKAAATAIKKASEEVDVATSAEVYDFEPDDFVTPTTARSKRKATKSAAKASMGSTSTQSSRGIMRGITASAPGTRCADAPIVQVKRALKKRKLAVKPIS